MQPKDKESISSIVFQNAIVGVDTSVEKNYGLVFYLVIYNSSSGRVAGAQREIKPRADTLGQREDMLSALHSSLTSWVIIPLNL